MYADDTTITSTLNTLKDQGGRIQNKQINNELDKINCWLKANKLSLNVKKNKIYDISSASNESRNPYAAHRRGKHRLCK